MEIRRPPCRPQSFATPRLPIVRLGVRCVNPGSGCTSTEPSRGSKGIYQVNQARLPKQFGWRQPWITMQGEGRPFSRVDSVGLSACDGGFVRPGYPLRRFDGERAPEVQKQPVGRRPPGSGRSRLGLPFLAY